MAEAQRAGAMASSLRAAFTGAGAGSDALERLLGVHAVAMRPRIDRLADDHHPAYLHPGRSALILLRDAQVADERTLALAMLIESRDEGLRVAEEAVARLAGREGDPATPATGSPWLLDSIASVPFPGDEALAERLVTLERDVCLAVLAERLDHLRHEHVRHEKLGEPADHWPALHAGVGEVWLPVAERTHPRLAQRYAHWWRTFGRRLRG